MTFYAHSVHSIIFVAFMLLQGCFFEETSNRLGRFTGISSSGNGLGINENGIHLLSSCLCQGTSQADGKSACKSVCQQNTGGSKAFVKVGLGKDFIKFKDIRSLCKRPEFKCDGRLQEEGSSPDQASSVPVETLNPPLQEYISFDLDLSEGQLIKPLSFDLLFGSQRAVKPISLTLDAGDGKVTELTKTYRYQCYEYFPVVNTTAEGAQTNDCLKGPVIEYFMYAYLNEFSVPSNYTGDRHLVCYQRNKKVEVDPNNTAKYCQTPLEGETDQPGKARLNSSEAMTLWSLSDGDFQAVSTDEGQGNTSMSYLIEDKIRGYRAIYSNQKKENVAIQKIFFPLNAPLKPNSNLIANYTLTNEYALIGAYLLPIPIPQGATTSYGCPTKEQFNQANATPVIKAIATSFSGLDINTLNSNSKPQVNIGTEPFFVACAPAEAPIKILEQEGAPPLQTGARVTFIGLKDLSKATGMNTDLLLRTLDSSTSSQISVKFKEPGLGTLGMAASERTFRIIHPYDYLDNNINTQCGPTKTTGARNTTISTQRMTRFRYMMVGCAPVTQ